MSALILIVDDEPDLVTTLAYNFERDGFRTVTARDGAAALAALERLPQPDLIVLDLMLPDMSGTEVCRRMRLSGRTRDIPVVMLTARGEESDRVNGFEAGADDYVIKPFSVRELLLRVGAVLRRARAVEGGPGGDERLRFATLELDAASHRVSVGGEEVALTALEFRLLHTFMSRSGRVQSRDALLSDVWGVDADLTTRTVDTHVKRLRQKLGAAGRYIETLRGVGYRFRDEPDDDS